MEGQTSLLKLVTMFVFMLGLNSSACATATTITITTVEEDRSLLLAQNLEYWLTGEHHKKHILECRSGLCSTWQLPANLVGKRAISIIALVDKPRDPTCADWYAGEILPKQVPINNHLEVQLKQSETACQ